MRYAALGMVVVNLYTSLNGLSKNFAFRMENNNLRLSFLTSDFVQLLIHFYEIILYKIKLLTPHRYFLFFVECLQVLPSTKKMIAHFCWVRIGCLTFWFLPSCNCISIKSIFSIQHIAWILASGVKLKK